MFLCTQIDEDDYRMTNYMEYSCYSFDHLKWAVFISAPILVIWVIGLPLVALLILLKNREHLDDWKIKKYFMILYQGFRKETFYWEFVSTFRKFSILAINAVLNNSPPTYKIFLAIAFLVVLYFLQKKIMPFSKREHNNIDLLGVNVGILTFYCTILFSQEDLSQRGFYLLALFIVFISNAYFMLKWFYLVLCEMKWNNPYFIKLLKIYSRAVCTEYTRPDSMPSAKPKTTTLRDVVKVQILGEGMTQLNRGKKKHKKRLKKRRKGAKNFRKNFVKENIGKKMLGIAEDSNFDNPFTSKSKTDRLFWKPTSKSVNRFNSKRCMNQN